MCTEAPSGGTREEQGASETLIFLNTRHLQRYPPRPQGQWPFAPVTQGSPFSTDVGAKAGGGQGASYWKDGAGRGGKSLEELPQREDPSVDRGQT